LVTKHWGKNATLVRCICICMSFYIQIKNISLKNKVLDK